jgi:hypothetical protein
MDQSLKPRKLEQQSSIAETQKNARIPSSRTSNPEAKQQQKQPDRILQQATAKKQVEKLTSMETNPTRRAKQTRATTPRNKHPIPGKQVGNNKAKPKPCQIMT